MESLLSLDGVSLAILSEREELLGGGCHKAEPCGTTLGKSRHLPFSRALEEPPS